MSNVGIEDGFLDPGGDSLIGLRMLARIREKFRVSISPHSLFAPRATIVDLALQIVAALASARPGSRCRRWRN